MMLRAALMTKAAPMVLNDHMRPTSSPIGMVSTSEVASRK